MSRVRKRRRRASHKLGMAAVTLVVAAMLCVLSVKMTSLRERDEVYAARESALEKQLETEKERSEQLEEQRIYVQTKQYIEEMARERWGLVHPGELILQPEE